MTIWKGREEVWRGWVGTWRDVVGWLEGFGPRQAVVVSSGTSYRSQSWRVIYHRSFLGITRLRRSLDRSCL